MIATEFAEHLDGPCTNDDSGSATLCNDLSGTDVVVDHLARFPKDLCRLEHGEGALIGMIDLASADVVGVLSSVGLVVVEEVDAPDAELTFVIGAMLEAPKADSFVQGYFMHPILLCRLGHG